jgi:BirA family biotin operon repressor/biotin-[acetyl-CoA-carboxylase] ligase
VITDTESAHGWTIHRYGTVDSTQLVAARLIMQDASHRTVVLAERQTAGYGRKGDPWRDAPGASVLATLILRPSTSAPVAAYVMAAALAVIRAIDLITGLGAHVKWPNDILVHGRKVAGILGDATWRGACVDAIRVGIGVNIRGDRGALIRAGLPNATSVAAEVGEDIDRAVFLSILLAEYAALDDILHGGTAQEILHAWRGTVATVGRAVCITYLDGYTLSGVASGVTPDGDLAVLVDDGATRIVRATDIRSLRHIGAEGEGE